jgi:hypothetical protein
VAEGRPAREPSAKGSQLRRKSGDVPASAGTNLDGGVDVQDRPAAISFSHWEDSNGTDRRRRRDLHERIGVLARDLGVGLGRWG